MIIPSMSIRNGKIADGGDPVVVAERFSLPGEFAVEDLDAESENKNNASLLEFLVRRFPCRVDCGIRDISSATKWLDKGAERVVISADVDLLFVSQLPKSRVIAKIKVVDSSNEEKNVYCKDKSIQRITEIKDLVGGILLVDVDKVGTQSGFDKSFVEQAIAAAGKRTPVTVAGGIFTTEQIAELDKMGADAQVGKALHSGKLNLADAIVAPIKTDRPDGLWATVVADELGRALGLVYSNLESVREAVRLKCGAYHSRSRGLWVKGLTSGNTQALLGIRLDCDRDAMYFTVRQGGEGFCHNHTWTCWGDDQGIGRLFRMLESRVGSAPEGSYTKRLLSDPELLSAKLVEEAKELAESSGAEQTLNEAADLLYFTLVAMVRSGVSLYEAEQEIYKRSLRVVRRGGDMKAEN